MTARDPKSEKYLPRLSLVVPVRNAGAGLRTTLRALQAFLEEGAGSVEVVLVDDASTDESTAVSLAAFAAAVPGARVLRSERRLGKGFAVRAGMLTARGAYRVFTDADLAYPLNQVDNVVAALRQGADVAIACRVLPESRYLIAPAFFPYLCTRHLLSRTFNAVTRALLLPGILDTQAGLKGFTAAAADSLFGRLSLSGFSFDLELLYMARAQGLQVRSVPVLFRYDDEPTTVRFLHDGFAMTRDLARLRWRGWLGRYRPDPAPAANPLPELAPAGTP